MVRSKKIQSRTRRNRRVRKSRRVKRTYRRRQRGGLSINANINNNNNNNLNIANNDTIDENINLDLIQDLYSAIDDVENAEERVNILKAIGGWLYAVFVTRPRLWPGDTKEGMILSILYETQKYLGYDLDRQTDDFNAVMDEMRKVHNRIRELEEGEKYVALNNLKETQEQHQEEYEAQYINQ
jgi:hypothetical protein